MRRCRKRSRPASRIRISNVWHPRSLRPAGSDSPVLPRAGGLHLPADARPAHQARRRADRGRRGAWATSLQILAAVLPYSLGLTIPMALLVGVLMGLGRLSGDREMVAIAGLRNRHLPHPLSAPRAGRPGGGRRLLPAGRGRAGRQPALSGDGVPRVGETAPKARSSRACFRWIGFRARCCTCGRSPRTAGETSSSRTSSGRNSPTSTWPNGAASRWTRNAAPSAVRPAQR